MQLQTLSTGYTPVKASNTVQAFQGTGFKSRVARQQDAYKPVNLQRNGECVLGTLGSCFCCCALLPAIAVTAMVVGAIAKAAKAAREVA
ncbi:MAG: hypothetical protein ACKO37_00030 [Vampirovibrionales bacterium]